MSEFAEPPHRGMPASVEASHSASPRGALLPALFHTEERYGWSIGMRAVTLALLSDLSLPHGCVVDLGCGGGAMLAQMQQRFTGRTVIGLDLHPLAVEQASRTLPGQVVRSNIAALPLADGCAALLTAFDSLDQHGVDLEHSLHEGRRVLGAGGCLLLRVSAFERLSGPHDRAFNTARRYNGEQVVHMAEKSGFSVERCTYANMLLSPPVVVMRLLQRQDLLPLGETLYASPTANRLMEAALSVEANVLRRRNLPFGLSLYVLMRKE